MIIKFITAIFFTCSIYFAQTYELKGRIIDAVTGLPLSFANIRVLETTNGTAANVTGEYSLKLSIGSYKLAASFIGYETDTVKVNLTNSLTVNFALNPATVELAEVTVTPGINPSIEIIKKAIQRKHERNSRLNSYIFYGYTKGKILTTEDISASSNRVGIGLGTADTSELKITGIIENQSKGYFLKPNYYKEEILARKQTSNFPSTINILTGGRLIQNFYSDDIQFFGNNLLSPIADNSLNYYYFYIEDTLAMDKNKIFQIYFSTIDNDDPGFYGRIFIKDKTYDLLKIDVDLNAAANPGGIFTKVNIFQQFTVYDSIYMPIDYRLFVEGNYLGLFKFGFELNSILYDYEINPGLASDDFSMLVLKVQPAADEKDSTYWQSVQTIPATSIETRAYQRIDSLESIERTFWDRFSILSSIINYDDNIYSSAPLGMYHFNNVEGHSIDFKFGLQNLLNDRFDSELNLSYGFSDKKLKKEFSAKYLFGDYRTYSVDLSIFDKTDVLFDNTDNYNSFTSTLTSLFGKCDFRDYYNTSGFEFDLTGEIFPILRLSLGFLNRTDKSLLTKSDFSFFSKDKSYSPNLSIYDTKINALQIGFDFDFRNYMEDGKFRRRLGSNNTRVSFGGDILLSPTLLNSEMDFQIYKFNINSFIKSFGSTSARININSTVSNGAIPFQFLDALPGNIESSGKSNSFRTLGFAEIYGDRVISTFIEYNFGSELWRLLNIPLLKDWQINLTGYVNGAFVDLSTESKNILLLSPKLFLKPFWEAGFGISHPLIPLQFEFTWKLNQRGDNNFVFGINTFVL